MNEETLEGVEKEWYSTYIEEPIRPIVKALRSVGMCTFCSCGHSMEVQYAMFDESDATWVHRAMLSIGFRKADYTIEKTGENTYTLKITKPGFIGEFRKITD